MILLALLACDGGSPTTRDATPHESHAPVAQAEDAAPTADPAPTPPDGPIVRPSPGVRLVVRIEHAGARPPVSAEDPAPRLAIEHEGGRTRVTARGAAWPIRTDEAWTGRESAVAWVTAVEGAGIEPRAALRVAGPGVWTFGTGARIAFRTDGAPDALLASALEPVFALSIGNVDPAEIHAATASLSGAIRSWEVRWPGRAPVRWIVEEDSREVLLLPGDLRGHDVPAKIAGSVGAAESAADLAARLSPTAAVDDRTSLTVRNDAERTLFVYVRGVLLGWVAPAAAGRFLGIPAGRHPIRATSLRGTVSVAGTAVVPGEWTATTAAGR